MINDDGYMSSSNSGGLRKRHESKQGSESKWQSQRRPC
jgi:hypothetical protein